METLPWSNGKQVDQLVMSSILTGCPVLIV